MFGQCGVSAVGHAILPVISRTQIFRNDFEITSSGPVATSADDDPFRYRVSLQGWSGGLSLQYDGSAFSQVLRWVPAFTDSIAFGVIGNISITAKWEAFNVCAGTEVALGRSQHANVPVFRDYGHPVACHVEWGSFFRNGRRSTASLTPLSKRDSRQGEQEYR